MLFNNNEYEMFQKEKLEELLKIHNVSRDQVLRDTLGKNAKLFANLTKTKTLSVNDILRIKSLGYTFKNVEVKI